MNRLWIIWVIAPLCFGCTKKNEAVEKRTLKDQAGQLPAEADATRFDNDIPNDPTTSVAEDPTTPIRLGSDPAAMLVATRDALKPCDGTLQGQLFIVEDEQIFVHCDSGTYRDVLPGALATGLNAIATEPVSPGDECLFGGVAVIAYDDRNGDSLVGDGETSSRQVVCALQGPRGEQGTTGTAGSSLGIIAAVLPTDSESCGGAGTQLQIFTDTNSNGQLDQGEAVISEPLICDGADGIDGSDGAPGDNGLDGLAAGIAMTPIIAGETCEAGGVLIALFTDTNGNGEQDGDEPTISSRSLCNGVQGDTGPQGPGGSDPIVCKQITVDPMKELIAVDPAVVGDSRALPGGKWHFGSLMRQMLPAGASATEASDFVKSWLATWETDVVIGTSTAEARPSISDQIICPWVNASFNNSNCAGNLDLDLAPFRLLAIVNRLDLGNGDTVAGEGRFVFGTLNAPTSNPVTTGNANLFTVILEYGLPTTELDPQDWATEWHKLGKLPCNELQGCEEYNSQLESITDKFSSRELDPSKTNGNPLNQLRTNEISLGSVWELREFKLRDISGDTVLDPAPVVQTPDASFDGTSELADFAEANKADIATASHAMPTSMQAAASQAPFGFPGWDLPGASSALQKEFSLNTCNGCHHSDTDTIDLFYHISPTQNPGVGRLSQFLRDELAGSRKTNMEQVALPPECRDL